MDRIEYVKYFFIVVRVILTIYFYRRKYFYIPLIIFTEIHLLLVDLKVLFKLWVTKFLVASETKSNDMSWYVSTAGRMSIN